ncbi:unnamed protein product [Symbiodinium sp. CCMP2456]|nr:unnamed protein product [Symbiodinium sp. CCMP2456]
MCRRARLARLAQLPLRLAVRSPSSFSQPAYASRNCSTGKGALRREAPGDPKGQAKQEAHVRKALFAQLRPDGGSKFWKDVSKRAAVVHAAEELSRHGWLRSTKDFTVVASSLIRASRWSRALVALTEELPDASLLPDAVAWNACAAACAAGSHWAGALALLERAADSSVPMLRAAMDACLKASLWQRALLLQPDGDVGCYAAAARALGRTANWQMALMLLQKSHCKTSRKDASQLLRDVLGVMAKAGKWKHACGVLTAHMDTGPNSDRQDRLRVAKFDNAALNAVIAACTEAARWEKALEVLQAGRGMRIQTDVVNHNAALAACARAAQWRSALELLAAMTLATGATAADVASFSIAITACEKAGRSREASQLMEDMASAGLPLDAIAFSACISACEKSNDWARALYLLTVALRQEQADSVSCSTTLSACEKASRWELALQLLSGNYNWEVGAVGNGAFLTSCKNSSRWMEALAVVHAKRRLDAIGLTSALGAAETAGYNGALCTVLRDLLHQTSMQLLFACRVGGGPAASRAHAASTGGLDVLDSHGLLHLGGLAVARVRVRQAALKEFQEKVAENPVLQSLCDLGRPCSRDAMEELKLPTQLSRWQVGARDVLAEVLLNASPNLQPLPIHEKAVKIFAESQKVLREEAEQELLASFKELVPAVRPSITCDYEVGASLSDIGCDNIPLVSRKEQSEQSYRSDMQDVHNMNVYEMGLSAGVVEDLVTQGGDMTANLNVAGNAMPGGALTLNLSLGKIRVMKAFVGASLNQECLNMMQFATSPVDAVHLIYTRSSDSTLAVNEDCKVLSCRVLANALYLMPDLQNGGANCTNQFEIKTPEDASFCPCSSLLAEIDSTVQAEIDSVCGSRLLKDGCGKYATEPSWCNSTGGRRLDVLETSEAAELPCKTPSWQEPPTLDSFLEVPSESRQLQQVNSDAPPWTVGPWSTCKCFEQCMPGLRSRIVQCGGSVCRGSQPESTQECTCTHCALCQHAEIVLHISLIINFSQAGMALILGLALGYFGSLGEEKLIKISLLSKLAGFFCKNLPMLENLADLVSLGLFVWLVIITYIPPIFELYWMQDCFQNELLRVSCSIPLLLWLCRLMLGRCAKRYTRVPPQLYSPVRRLPMGIKHINAFMRCLGPV